LLSAKQGDLACDGSAKLDNRLLSPKPSELNRRLSDTCLSAFGQRFGNAEPRAKERYYRSLAGPLTPQQPKTSFVKVKGMSRVGASRSSFSHRGIRVPSPGRCLPREVRGCAQCPRDGPLAHASGGSIHPPPFCFSQFHVLCWPPHPLLVPWSQVSPCSCGPVF
jgi:hypothetical protein